MSFAILKDVEDNTGGFGMRRMMLIILAMSFMMTSFVYAREVPYTQEDRDRLIRVETKVEEGLKAVNQRIDALQDLIYILIGAIFAQTVGVMGFVLWDRRTALAPAVRKTKELDEELAATAKKTKELEEREYMLEKAIRDYAQQEPKLAEVLRAAKLL